LIQAFQVNKKQYFSFSKPIFLALQLATTTPLLPINSAQQSVEESAILRTLRMNALQVRLI